MARRTKDQRREDYLDIGAALVAESARVPGGEPGLALAHVKLADVAARAGVTKGALYHIWPSQESYWRDLLEHLLATDRLAGAERVARVAEQLSATAADGPDPTPSLRSYADALFEALRADPAFFTRISLFSYLDHDRVRAVLDAEFRESVELLLPVLEQAVADMGRRMVDGATTWDLAVAASALLEGLSLQYRIDPGRVPDLDLPGRDPGAWSLFAAAAEALLVGYTEPVDGAGS